MVEQMKCEEKKLEITYSFAHYYLTWELHHHPMLDKVIVDEEYPKPCMAFEVGKKFRIFY
jgi:hypothetical protein